MIKHFWSLLVLLLASSFAQAFEIQEITSPKGIKAWLVEAHDVPIVSLHFSFEGARDLEVVGKEGSLGLLTACLKEGAGTNSSEVIKTKLAKMSSNYGFYATADNTMGQLQTLKKNLSETADLLKASVENPQFEALALERERDHALQDIKRAKADQWSIAEDAWYAAAFPNHLYGTSSRGTEAGINSVTADDLRVLWKRITNRRDMNIVAVGDITPSELAAVLDQVFGNLPDLKVLVGEQPTPMAKGPIEQRIAYDNPQTVVYFGNPSVEGQGPEGWASYLLAEILGGRASFARLNQSLREKSGLTYGVTMSDNDWEFGEVQYGTFSTANNTTDQALQVLRKELADMALNGPTSEELRKVKSFINGSYPLGFSDNNSIAQELLSKMQRGLSPTYFAERAGIINAVTLEQVKAQAAKLLKPENQIVVIVGGK